ncbi:sensor domain-containing diguanylate cyclase [Aliiglaciecola litoralis]|uniref:GGDEF domain-containing protein n=1 Tax=Aliiglaciecola litoralis TaxID=582857 RepID=A0ABN1LD50_9ALTE
MSLTASSTSELNTVNAIRHILNVEQNLSGIEYLKVLLSNIAKELGFKYVFIGHTNPNRPNTIETDVVYKNGALQPNFDYELMDTPCKKVMSGQRVCVHEDMVFEKFPNDALLQEMGIRSYAGSPTISPRGELLGLLVLADDKPMHNGEQLSPLVEFLAQRITAEYERFKIEHDLHTIIEQRTEALESSNAHLRRTIEELEVTKRELEQRNHTDALTAVHRREWFTELAVAELKIAKRNHYPLALLFIDLDHFKSVNDSYGHVTGDLVLKEAAARISRNIRETDILGRFGGEEFVLLSPFADTESSMYLAERIRNEISNIPIHTSTRDISITVSIGIATLDNDEYELISLMEHADSALYQAKNSGRNTCISYRVQ